MFKIIQARLQQYMNQELADVQAGFRNGRGIRGQIVIKFGKLTMVTGQEKVSFHSNPKER